jgi:hypothetical protein
MKATGSTKTVKYVKPKYLQYNDVFGFIVSGTIICILMSAAFIAVQKRCSGVPLSGYFQCLPANSKINLK